MNNKQTNPNDGISPTGVVDGISVLCDIYNAGTFNGVMETIHTSMEKWIKEQVMKRIPGVILDFRTSLRTCFEYLCGMEKQFYVRDSFGKEHLIYPNNSENIFTREGARFLDALICERNNHVHVAPVYDTIATFSNIRIPAGSSHVLIFNPRAKNQCLVIDNACRADVTAHTMVIRPSDGNFDMDLTEQNFADLIVECLTAKEFKEEYLNEPSMGSNTHALVILYGKAKFFAYIPQRTYNTLHGIFDVEHGNRWKTHYYIFKISAILNRLLRIQ